MIEKILNSGAEIISVKLDDDGKPYEIWYREGECIFHIRTDTIRIEYWSEMNIKIEY